MKKNNTWNIRRLVDDSFVPMCGPATERDFILDWRILDLYALDYCQIFPLLHLLSYQHLKSLPKENIGILFEHQRFSWVLNLLI